MEKLLASDTKQPYVFWVSLTDDTVGEVKGTKEEIIPGATVTVTFKDENGQRLQRRGIIDEVLEYTIEA